MKLNSVIVWNGYGGDNNLSKLCQAQFWSSINGTW